MELTDQIRNAHAALAVARQGEVDRITEAARESRIVGVIGEGEVGKTKTVHQAIVPLLGPASLIYLDLDGAASDEYAAFQLAKEIARAELGAVDFSVLSANLLLPSRVEAGRAALAELLGVDGLEEAVREWPTGELPLSRAMAALESYAARSQVVLWIDHLEAPLLTPRHPLDLNGLLWAVRELSQRERGLRVVLAGREGVGPRALGPKGAFHQQGRWLTLDVPPTEIWLQTGRSLGLPEPSTAELARMLGGHPASVLRALLASGGSHRGRHPYEIVQDLVASDSGMIGRAMQHARSLHRLGGQVLTQIAYDQRPTSRERRGRASSQEIHKVLLRLRLAGLIRSDRDGWAVVNPLVGMGIRQSIG